MYLHLIGILVLASSRLLFAQYETKLSKLKYDFSSQVDTTLPSRAIGSYLKSLVKRELGEDHLYQLLEENVNKLPTNDPEDILSTFADNLSNKLDKVKNHLDSLIDQFAKKEELFNNASEPIQLNSRPCCSNHNSQNHLQSCALNRKGEEGQRLAHLATELFQQSDKIVEISRKYFISKSSHVEFPSAKICGHKASLWHQDVVAATRHPDQKFVIIILDRGSSLSTLQLNVGRAIAIFLLENLNDNDFVSLITLDRNATLVSECGLKMQKATSSTKAFLHSHLNKFNQFSTPHLDPLNGFHLAEELIDDATSDLKAGAIIDLFFVTTATAIQSSPNRLIDFYEKFVERKKFSGQIFLHLYFMDGTTSTTSSTNEKVRNDYNLNHFTKASNNLKNFEIKVVDSTVSLRYTIGDCFKHHLQSSSEDTIFLSPRVDDKGSKLEVIFPLAKSIVRKNESYVIGIDTSYQYLMEDFIYFLHQSDFYIFVLDKETHEVVYHPKLYESYANHLTFPQGILLADLEDDMEIDPAFKSLQERFFNSSKNSIQFGATNEASSDPLKNDGIRTNLKNYYWKHVLEKFVIVIVQSQNLAKIHPFISPFALIKKLSISQPQISNSSCVYHRLDLLPPQLQSKLCRHFDFPATLETGSVFLSPKAFLKPYRYTSQNMTEQRMQDLMNYLTNTNDDEDEDDLDIGVKILVKRDVHLLSQILSDWINMSFSSGMNNYIVRRYASTPNGIHFAFPGSPMIKETNPTAQDWYLTAWKFLNRVVVTRPRLDIGGAGYITTISKLIHHNVDPSSERLGALSKRDGGAVMGMDLTIGYLHKMLFDAMPVCKNIEEIRCFLFDDEGYLIVHKSQFEPIPRLEVPHHLTHVEHLAIKLMLSDPTLVTRRRCKDWSTMSVQYYYKFNTKGLVDQWNNDGDGDSCLKYKISLVPDTNLFLGIVMSNATCSTRESMIFCPCNIAGHQCILCEEVENDKDDSVKCECPCQCPLYKCLHQDLPTCSQQPQRIEMRSNNADHQSLMLSNLALPSCFDTDCSKHSYKDKCFGVIGCSWCEYEWNQNTNEANKMIKPFCSESSKCFAGILGSPTPYDRLERGSRLIDEDNYFSRPTPSIGPIAGSIVSAILFLGISAYCIRNYNKCVLCRPGDYNTCSSRNQRNSSNIGMSQFEEILEDQQENDNDEESEQLCVTNNQNLVLNNQNGTGNNAIYYSPYRMNPAYRRPEDSDHGYSTMTPMGDIDSEIVPYVDSSSARIRLQRMQQKRQQSIQSGSSRTSPTPIYISSKAAAMNSNTSSSPQCHSLSSSSENQITRGVTAATKNQKLPFKINRSFSESSEENNTAAANSNLQEPLDPITMLPKTNRNQFIVSATIHMVDT